MFSPKSRHAMLQSLFWNPLGCKIIPKISKAGVIFHTVVRGFSLIPASNGEKWLPTLAGDESVMFDVGYYSGSSTKEFLGMFPNSVVHAFDPSKYGSENYERDYGADPRVVFSSAAVSEEVGELEFYDYENMCNSLAQRKEMPGAKPEVYTVPVTTLDTYCDENSILEINHLKIDAEGYDLEVLRGASRLLDNQKIEILMFEFASGWAATRHYLWEAVEYFEGKPYGLYRLFNGFLVPVEYSIHDDSCTTRPAMYVAVSEKRASKGDIPVREYKF